jgi:hypothetical protein
MVDACMLNLFSTFLSGEGGGTTSSIQTNPNNLQPNHNHLLTTTLQDLADQSPIPQPTMQPPTLNLKPVDRTSSSSKRPARRPVPDARQVDPINNVRPTWEYTASKDGRDRNLIIMLHGVGTF